MDDSLELPDNPCLVSSTPVKRTFNDSAVSAGADITLDVTLSGLDSVERRSETNIFKLPKRPKLKKVKPTRVCPHCGKGYICTKSFNTHVLHHKLQDNAARFPNREGILENVSDIGASTLCKVAVLPAAGDRGGDFRKLVNEVQVISNSQRWKNFLERLSNKLLDNVVGQKFLLPSALLKNLVDQVDLVLSDRDLCAELLGILNVPVIRDTNLHHQFLQAFILAFAKELLSFISKSVRSYSDNLLVRKIPEPDQTERETIYYIGGAIFHGIMQIGRRYQNSSKWVLICQAVTKCALTDQPVGDSNWVLALDRGGLLYLTRQCQDFFIALTKVVYSLEQKDGSIPCDAVVKSVTSCDIMSVIWDIIFKDDLPQDVSLNLMIYVIEKYCKVCGGGVAKKRLNNLRKGPVVSMPTRHLVATRRQK